MREDKTATSSSLLWRHLYQAAYVEVRSRSSRQSVKIVTSPLILTVLKMKVRDDPIKRRMRSSSSRYFVKMKTASSIILLSPLSSILEIFLSSRQNKNAWLTTNAALSFLSVRRFYTFKFPKVSRFQTHAVTSSLFIGANARIPIVTKQSTNSYIGFHGDPCCSLYFDGWSLKIPSWIWHSADRRLIPIILLLGVTVSLKFTLKIY